MFIEISGVTNGTGPYDIYLCTWNLLSCFYVSGVTTIPPNIVVNSDNYFPNLELLKLKIVDNYGCVEIIETPCEPTPTPSPTPTATPTPTPTATPTPTPTPTPLPCYCYTLEGGGLTGATFDYHDCSSIPQTSVVGSGVTVNVCMSTTPTITSGTGGSAYYGLCSGGVCPP